MEPAQRHLVLLRHAKSAWPDGVPDLRRPLAKRGRRDAAAVGRWLHERAPRLDAVVCSPAERARQTWTLVAAELDDPPPASYDERVYGATATQLLALLRNLPDEINTAVLIGHNPDLQELAELLTGQDVEMKTSAVAIVASPGRWTDTGPGTMVLRHHATPRG
jgi:phosphohistidine phosphatase